MHGAGHLIGADHPRGRVAVQVADGAGIPALDLGPPAVAGGGPLLVALAGELLQHIHPRLDRLGHRVLPLADDVGPLAGARLPVGERRLVGASLHGTGLVELVAEQFDRHHDAIGAGDAAEVDAPVIGSGRGDDGERRHEYRGPRGSTRHRPNQGGGGDDGREAVHAGLPGG
ncbi:MAG: hypothetical protein FJ284_10080 [Planctomycetes bacterium]|nr:hypothetical protein [Planctomycetota bacterium]